MSDYNLTNPYESLKITDFRYFLLNRVSMMMAFQIQSIAVAIQVYDMTKDPLSLGFLGLSVVLPNIFVSLYAGYIADLYDRRKIMLFCISSVFLLSVILFLLNLPQVNQYTGYTPYHIYFIMFFIGTAKGFVNPASFGFMGQIIPSELYKNGALWGSNAFTTGLVAGPVLGGFIYDGGGPINTYFINSVVFLFAFLFIFKTHSREMPVVTKKPPLLGSIKEGLKFVFDNEFIIGAISLDLFAVLFGGAVALLPIFAKDILQVNSFYLGILRTSPALGAIITSIIFTHKPITKNAGKYFLSSVAGFGVCMILFALSKSFWFSFFLLFMSGAFDEISVLVRSTIMQTMIPDEMRGRVSAVNSIFIGASNELGEFESGMAAKLMTTVPSVIFGGCVTLFVVIVTAFKAKKLRNLDF